MLQKMKKFLIKVFNKLNNLFTSSFEFVKRNSIIAVRITDTLKNVVENKLTEFAVAVIPGEIDDRILKILQKVVPEVSYKIAVVHGLLQEGNTKVESIDKIIEYLKTLNPDARISFWVMFAGELNVALADGKINLAEGIALSQLMYNEYKNRK